MKQKPPPLIIYKNACQTKFKQRIGSGQSNISLKATATNYRSVPSYFVVVFHSL